MGNRLDARLDVAQPQKEKMVTSLALTLKPQNRGKPAQL